MEYDSQTWEYIKHIKWESDDIYVENKQIAIKYIDSEPQAFDIQLLTIKRNDNGNLELTIVSDNDNLQKYLKNTPYKKDDDGFFIDTYMVINYYSDIGTLQEIHIKDTGSNSFQTKEEGSITKNIISFSINGNVTHKTQDIDTSKETSLKEWYLNSMPCNKIFSDSFKEQLGFTYLSNYEKINILLPSFRFETLFLDLGTFKIFINNADIGLSIEYRSTWGEIPSTETRNKIGIILSFMLGRQLFKIGESEYMLSSDVTNNVNSTIVDSNLCHSHSLYLSKKYNYGLFFEESAKTPSRIIFPSLYTSNDRKNEDNLLKQHIEMIIKNYIRDSDEYKLDSILHRYFTFNISPIEYGIPLLATSLEMLSNIVAKKENKETIITDDEFKVFSKEIEPHIPAKLKNKITNLNSKSIGDKLKELILFYGLDYEIYNPALKIRNDLNHGSSNNSNRKLVDASRRLKELLILIVLSILKYEGSVELELNILYNMSSKERSEI